MIPPKASAAFVAAMEDVLAVYTRPYDPARPLVWHYTPKHGSWLNIAECGLSVLARQCLDRRIPDHATLETEVAAWTQNRNNAQAKTKWHFTTENARQNQTPLPCTRKSPESGD